MPNVIGIKHLTSTLLMQHQGSTLLEHQNMNEKCFMPEKSGPCIKHKVIRPPVLYVGTPIQLITTCNQDGTANISPMSSAWALGDRLVLGISSSSQCHKNMLREKECVVNFPSASLWPSVESIARSTGRYPVPPHKIKIGYKFVKDKFVMS